MDIFKFIITVGWLGRKSGLKEMCRKLGDENEGRKLRKKAEQKLAQLERPIYKTEEKK